MKLSGIVIQNFACFGEDTQWVWDEGVNDYLVRGVVMDTKEDSNGAGKTSLFEAVYWCLFGRTIRGVTAGEVVRDGARKALVVTYWVLADGSIIEVERVWSKTKKEVSITTYMPEGSPEVFTYHTAAEGTEAVKALLQVDEDLFAMAVFYGRGFKTFVGLSPKERSELLNRLAKADRWLAAQAVVSRWEVQARQSMTACTAQAENLHGYAEEQHSKAAYLLQEAQEAEDTLEQEVAEVQVRVTAAEETLGAVTTKQKALRKKLDKSSATLDTVQEQWQEAFKTGASTDAAKVSKAQERERAERALKKDLQAVCEWCGKRLPEEAAKAQQDRITHLQAEERATIAAANTAKQQLSKLEAARNEVQTTCKLYRQELAELDREERKARAMKQEAEATIQTLRGASRSTLLRAQAQAATEAAINYEADAKRQRTEAKKHDLLRRQSSLWRLGFKRVHSVVLENAFKAFEQLVNVYAGNLGLDMDRVTLTAHKDGGTKTAITLTLHRGDYARSMESLSEGEAARMNLACFFAFGDLFGQVSGVAVALRVLDEPLHGLDKSGKAAVFRTIKDTLSKDKQLFVIDHDAHFADQFTNVITVAKDSNRIATVVN